MSLEGDQSGIHQKLDLKLSPLGPCDFLKPISGPRMSRGQTLGSGNSGELQGQDLHLPSSVSGSMYDALSGPYWLLESLSQIILLPSLCQHIFPQTLPRTEDGWTVASGP